MYLPPEVKREKAKEIAELFFKEDMVFFVKTAANLYEEYGEYTADEIMEKARRKILATPTTT